MRTIKGPAIFLAQFAGDAAPFDTLDNICKWAADLGYKIALPLDAIAGKRGQTLAQMALAWVLRRGRVTSALIGASRPEQVEDCVGALKVLDFSDTELAEIDTYARESDINLWAASAERKGPPRK